ncbi:MAG: class I SAM-dependent methyltransferase [Myxococcales bacterium]|nr:class I SAM-dependent methyltransferase [Myxococcales bacterium]
MDPDLPKSIDFDPVAPVYDLYAEARYDLAFWTRVLAREPEPRLELMAGTGRICLALRAAGVACDALDYSEGMLAELRRKAAAAGLAGRVHHADARSFALDVRYGCIFIGFGAIAEVVDDADKARLFATVWAHLVPGGVFWLTAHNPPARRGFYDGSERPIGDELETPEGERLTVTGRFVLDPASGIVTGEQRYRFRRDVGDERGPGAERVATLPLRFHLVEPAWLEGALGRQGFVLRERHGDYEGAPFDPASSPFWIARFERPR